MSALSSLQEKAFIEKQTGQVVGPYEAMFTGKTIFIMDACADVEVGDTVIRKLPNGRNERSVVSEAQFISVGIRDGQDGHFQIKVSDSAKTVSQPHSHHITISNAHSVQIGDHSTQSIINSFEALIKKLEAAESTPKQKEEAKSLLGSFLKHPLVVSVLGSAAKGIFS
jgi:hypothetical protein